tara:strand:+ start:69 stop:872 length:804 start_codon:yes stop_codon:yes gene_type:complete
MRTCIIQKNNAPASLVRFTEVKCFFNYKNEWLGFFDKVIITDDADAVATEGWKINAGQCITTKIRTAYENKFDLDLRNKDITLDFDKEGWSEVREMQQYRGKKQEYIFRNYMVMILKSREKNVYFSNNELLPAIKNHKGKLWVPASGNMAGRIQFNNPEAEITIYDINPIQLAYSKWLNSQMQYPTSEQVDKFVSTLGKISISEKFNEDVKNWTPVNANYECVDILEKKLNCFTVMSNILEYMPTYHKHGSEYIQNWKKENFSFIIN